jgi:hypothetical protein
MNAGDGKYLTANWSPISCLCTDPVPEIRGVATATSGSVFKKRGSKGGSTIVIAASAVVIWDSDGKTV